MAEEKRDMTIEEINSEIAQAASEINELRKYEHDKIAGIRNRIRNLQAHQMTSAGTNIPQASMDAIRLLARHTDALDPTNPETMLLTTPMLETNAESLPGAGVPADPRLRNPAVPPNSAESVATVQTTPDGTVIPRGPGGATRPLADVGNPARLPGSGSYPAPSVPAPNAAGTPAAFTPAAAPGAAPVAAAPVAPAPAVRQTVAPGESAAPAAPTGTPGVR